MKFEKPSFLDSVLRAEFGFRTPGMHIAAQRQENEMPKSKNPDFLKVV